ncbi:MAG: hypothetical protein DRI37_07210 [Chloroflexi bacterium]|nr:MAG: hypothetical protein DRI37_07210 [Chloroflexota bacterium]
MYQEVNFLPRIGEHCLLTLRTDCTDFFIFFSREFALFAVDFSSTMRNPKEPVIKEQRYPRPGAQYPTVANSPASLKEWLDLIPAGCGGDALADTEALYDEG